MAFWPFKRRDTSPPSPVELREKLIAAAATGSKRKLRSVCAQYKSQVAEHVETLCKIPDEVLADDRAIDRYVQCLGAAAECLAHECGAPELWDKLSGDAASNPLIQWDRWFGDLPERMQRLEYEELIAEADAFLEQAETMKGDAARRYEAMFQGRRGELLFQSGRVSEAEEPLESALKLCETIGDVEGEFAYLNCLLEVHRYLDDGRAVEFAERILELRRKSDLPTRDAEQLIKRLSDGEPLCRVVCARDGRELELDEITEISDGRYQFLFRRNRLSLQTVTSLTEQGNDLASSGNHSDALEKYHEASDIDLHDPDPVYQSGVCLLELGAYAKAKEAFEEVERLAPGWFRCRADRWLAEGLERGTISDEEFRVLRALEDGGLDAAQVFSLAEQAIERFPDFAPLRLLLGDLCRNQGNEKGAIEAYRAGLKLVEEPDLESRLLCALAGSLPAESPERKELVERAARIEGSLVAQATAKLMALQQ